MQADDLMGRLVSAMIRRSVRQRFRRVLWNPPAGPISAPAILYANHHGWMDGYVMFHVVEKLGLRSLDWIQEFDAFPLFRSVGGMPYPKDRPEVRAATIRKTIRMMNEEQRSLVLFAEGILHRPPELLPFGRALEVVATRVKAVTLVPVALRYEMSLHERPEARVNLGEPHGWANVEDCEQRMARLLGEEPDSFDVLAEGTADVNERMDMRRIRDGREVRKR